MKEVDEKGGPSEYIKKPSKNGVDEKELLLDHVGTSALTNRIYFGKAKKEGGLYHWIGKKKDITDDAIKSVFVWFMHNCEKGGQTEPEHYSITFDNVPYVLEMRMKNKGEL
jgi:hypothetical protein